MVAYALICFFMQEYSQIKAVILEGSFSGYNVYCPNAALSVSQKRSLLDDKPGGFMPEPCP
jgi:hypothetical protein